MFEASSEAATAVVEGLRRVLSEQLAEPINDFVDSIRYLPSCSQLPYTQ